MGQIRVANLLPFDIAEHLSNEDEIAAFLADIAADNDPKLLEAAKLTAERARSLNTAAHDFRE